MGTRERAAGGGHEDDGGDGGNGGNGGGDGGLLER